MVDAQDWAIAQHSRRLTSPCPWPRHAHDVPWTTPVAQRVASGVGMACVAPGRASTPAASTAGRVRANRSFLTRSVTCGTRAWGCRPGDEHFLGACVRRERDHAVDEWRDGPPHARPWCANALRTHARVRLWQHHTHTHTRTPTEGAGVGPFGFLDRASLRHWEAGEGRSLLDVPCRHLRWCGSGLSARCRSKSTYTATCEAGPRTLTVPVTAPHDPQPWSMTPLIQIT